MFFEIANVNDKYTQRAEFIKPLGNSEGFPIRRGFLFEFYFILYNLTQATSSPYHWEAFNFFSCMNFFIFPNFLYYIFRRSV